VENDLKKLDDFDESDAENQEKDLNEINESLNEN